MNFQELIDKEKAERKEREERERLKWIEEQRKKDILIIFLESVPAARIQALLRVLISVQSESDLKELSKTISDFIDSDWLSIAED